MKETKTNIGQNLLSQLKEGSPIAFQTLFDIYSQKVYHFSLGYLKNTQDAEEIVQEVFLKIWKIREELSTEDSFNSFLFTIAKNAVLNTIRKQKYKQAYLNYSRINPTKNILLDEELDFRELERAYNLSVEKLSPKRKEIFKLSRMKGLSNAEIADVMNISVKTVENQMTSALREIKLNLRSAGFSGLIFFDLFLF